jgi:hypothetical protein
MSLQKLQQPKVNKNKRIPHDAAAVMAAAIIVVFYLKRS